MSFRSEIQLYLSRGAVLLIQRNLIASYLLIQRNLTPCGGQGINPLLTDGADAHTTPAPLPRPLSVVGVVAAVAPVRAVFYQKRTDLLIYEQSLSRINTTQYPSYRLHKPLVAGEGTRAGAVFTSYSCKRKLKWMPYAISLS